MPNPETMQSPETLETLKVCRVAENVSDPGCVGFKAWGGVGFRFGLSGFRLRECRAPGSA